MQHKHFFRTVIVFFTFQKTYFRNNHSCTVSGQHSELLYMVPKLSPLKMMSMGQPKNPDKNENTLHHKGLCLALFLVVVFEMGSCSVSRTGLDSWVQGIIEPQSFQ